MISKLGVESFWHPPTVIRVQMIPGSGGVEELQQTPYGHIPKMFKRHLALRRLALPALL